MGLCCKHRDEMAAILDSDVDILDVVGGQHKHPMFGVHDAFELTLCSLCEIVSLI